MEESHYCNNCQKQIVAANFAIHSAHCERFIKVCKLCDESISICEEENHLEEFHSAVPCDLCGILLEKWTLPKHQETCTKRLVTCKYCEGEFPFEEFPDHFEFCSSRTEKCVLCQKYVMLKDKEKHSEIHLCERKIRLANIDKEVKQNIINEAISNSTSPEQDIQKKVDEASDTNTSIIGDDIMADKDETHLRIRVPAGANGCASDIPNEMSKHYTTCYICNQTIPWIDMNTHIPSCASDAGKCSRCGESVPNHEFKEHILKKCKTLLAEGSSVNKIDLKQDRISKDKPPLYVAGMDIDEQDMKQCSCCKQLCSVDRIAEHMKSCSEIRYECPYCCASVAEKEKGRHEAFECSVLLEIQGHVPFDAHSSSDATRNSPEKYKYTSDTNIMAKSRNARDKSSLHKSYADASRKLSSQNEKHPSKCRPCCPCHEKSPHNMQDHSYTGEKSKKGSCFYCFEEIDTMKEDLHLSTCRAFKDSNGSDPEHQTSHKGAIPKRTSFADIVKPRMAKCKFCKTAYTVDILFQHEKGCTHQPFTCEECEDTFPLKDLEDHRCKLKRRGKQKQEEVQKKTAFGFGFKSILSNIGKLGNNGTSENSYGYDSNRFHSTYSPYSTSTYSPYTTSTYSSDMFDADVKIPCEFCEKLFPASKIVEHETGCAPDLVSLPRKDSHEGVSRNPVSPKQSYVPQENSTPGRKFPSFETKTELLYCRSEGIKKYMESDVIPGEFLESTYGVRTSETSKDQKNGSVAYSPSSSIHSVWNISSSDTRREAGYTKALPHTSSLDEGKESETSCDTQKQFEDKEIFNSDDEMTDLLEFIHEDKTNAADKEAYRDKCEELYREYSKGSSPDITYHPNLDSQRHNEDVPENQKFLQLAEPANSINQKTMKPFGESEKHTFDVKRLKHHHLPNVASENRAFTIEPAENCCLEHISVKKMEIEEEIEDSVRDDQDAKLNHASQENYSETYSEDDLEKWAKWRSRNSSSNS